MNNENKILSDKAIMQFDYAITKEKIISFIETIEILKYKIGNFSYPKITSNYEMKFESIIPITSSKLEDFVLSKIDNEEKLKEHMSKYATAYNSLNKEEKVVFAKTYIIQEKTDNISNQHDYFYDRLVKIRKSSTIKFALVLGLEVYKTC